MKSYIAFTCVIAARLINAEINTSGDIEKTNDSTEITGRTGVINEYTHFYNQTRFDMTVNKTRECNEIYGANFTLAATNYGDWTLYATGLNDTFFESLSDLFYHCVDPDTSLPILMENRAFGAPGGEGQDDDYLENTNGPNSVTLVRGPMMRGTLVTSQFGESLANQCFFLPLANESKWRHLVKGSKGYSRAWSMNSQGCCQSESYI